MDKVASIADLRQLHRRRVPRMFFDYCDRGSYAEETLDANRRDLQALTFRQRVMVDISERSLATTILGEPVSFPLMLAPTGLTGMQHGDGEILAARAAERAGIPFCLSTMSICSIEDVAAAVEKPFWFQLYIMKDRAFTSSLIERARSARCSALVLTVDLAIQGQRHRDIKNGLTVPLRWSLANLASIAARPRWAFGVLRGRRKTFGNLIGWLPDMRSVGSFAQWTANQFDQSITWRDVAWVRSLWPGKLILKGILDADDARMAVETGADAIVVSNHGGRQLDGAQSTIAVLPKIADAVGGETEILFDSGVRSGQDVLRALALGARGAMIGRAFLYGLGARGEAGVSEAIEIIRKEMEITMILCGRRTIAEVDQSILAR